MTLFKALALSEELNCAIIHRQAGLTIRSEDIPNDFGSLPTVGWALDDSPMPTEFEARFLGCELMDSSGIGGKKGAVYCFEGEGIHTLMPVGTLVKVRIEPV